MLVKKMDAQKILGGITVAAFLGCQFFLHSSIAEDDPFADQTTTEEEPFAFADGVQRISGEWLLDEEATFQQWFREWRKNLFPRVMPDGHQVVFMLVRPLPKGGTEAISIVTEEVPRVLEDGFPAGIRAGKHFVIRSAIGSPENPVEMVEVGIADISALVSSAFALVKVAEAGTQEQNFVLGPNEDWFVFAAKMGEDRLAHSRLHVGHGINPPEKGVLRSYHMKLERLLADSRIKPKRSEQDGADQPATAPESKSKDKEKPKIESGERSQ